ncbi:transposase family protein [Mycobacterium ulcerans str. Harvey]|uniref:Transposase family protein n=1 Tax=Mycobacterium ulcerans str. Harvey TaxID=1299332 RepID=A0ABN0QPD8_MYCUL|nr:transposase family protein [Mycobacterium ulcerans str. Harvey]
MDTHAATHHGAVIDSRGRLLADAEYPASGRGYAAMLTWMRSKGNLTKVGVEGTGAYGAGLARYLHEQGVEVLEVPAPTGASVGSAARATRSMLKPRHEPSWQVGQAELRS